MGLGTLCIYSLLLLRYIDIIWLYICPRYKTYILASRAMPYTCSELSQLLLNWAELNKSNCHVLWMLCHVMYFCPHFWFYVFRCLCSTMYFWFLGLLLCHTPSYAVWLQVSALSGHVWSSSAKCCTSCKPLSLRLFLLTVPWWASKTGNLFGL